MSAPIFHEQLPNDPLAEVGKYTRLAEAREHGLVFSSMGIQYWIPRQGRSYLLVVLEADRERAVVALAEYVKEEASRPSSPVIEPLRIPKFGVIMALLVMIALFSLQQAMPAWWTEGGAASDLRIRQGEWWRAFTALTLHGDTQHLVSNLSLAVFVFAFVFGLFGIGFGTLGILLGGALGNLLNTAAHMAVPHISLGSSTALFAGLGMISGGELAARVLLGGVRAGWPLIVPLGAGFAFLSLFGGGGGQNPDGTPAPLGNVDLLAHLFGLLAGLAVGFAFHWWKWRIGASPLVQTVAGWVGALLVIGAWLLTIGSW